MQRILLAALGILSAFAGPSCQAAGDAAAPVAVTTESERALIGRLLFFDTSLSASGKLSCATCHDPRYAYGPPPGKALAVGGADMQQPGTRAVPSLRYLNSVPPFEEHYRFLDGDVAPIGGFTWDGRARSLHEQAAVPLLAPNEMANRSPADVARAIERGPYADRFRVVFGRHVFARPDEVFRDALLALEAFQRIPEEFFPYSSRYDAYLRGEVDLTEPEERGVDIFKDPAKGNCASCHLGVSREGVPPPFTDYDYVNVGVPRNAAIPANADPNYFDLGLCGPARTEYLGRREYCGFFRSPTLRNVALRDAFFHNGVFSTLRQVIEFYNERDLHPQKFYPRNADGSVHLYDDIPPGFAINVDRDPPLDRASGAQPALTDAQIDDLIAFLETLTDGYRRE